MQGLNSFSSQHPSSQYDILQRDSEEAKEAKNLEHTKNEKGKQLNQHNDSGEEQMEPTFVIRGRDNTQVLLYLPKRSLYLFDKDNFLRKKLVEIVNSQDFDNFILLCIFVNSLLIAFQDYQYPLNNSNIWNLMSAESELFFTFVFILECAFKIIAQGFVIDQNSYLRDAWNWLDFVVVITSILPGASNQSSLRTVRLFKPLKSLNAIPSMKKLMKTIIDSMISLVNILALMAFFFVIFAILSVNLWKGHAHQHCRLTPVPIDGWWPVLQDYEHLCRLNQTCPSRLSDQAIDTQCGSTYSDTLLVFNDLNTRTKLKWFTDILFTYGRQDVQNSYQNWGQTTFDSVPSALIAIFQSTTLEGWAQLMQRVVESYNTYIAQMFFIAIFFVCAFLILNLIIAVLWEKQVQNEEGDGSEDNVDALEEPEPEMEEEEEESEKGDEQEEGWLHYSMQFIYTNFLEFKWIDKVEIENELHEGGDLLNTPYDNQFQAFMYNLQNQMFFSNFIYFSILANTLTLAFDRQPPNSVQLQYQLTLLNYFFTFVFTLEAVIKLVALGFERQCAEYFNIFDLVIVIISLVEILIERVIKDFGFKLSLTPFRTLRLMRVIKLIKSNESLSLLIETIIRTVFNLATFALLLSLMIVVFTLIGMNFFAGKIKLDGDGWLKLDKQGQADHTAFSPKHNFDTFSNSFVTIFQVLTAEDWHVIMQDAVRSTNVLYFIYFIIVIILGNFIMLNLFLAILLGNFMEARNAIEAERTIRLKKDKDKRRQKQLNRNTDLIEADLEMRLQDNNRDIKKKSIFEKANDESKNKQKQSMNKDNVEIDSTAFVPQRTTTKVQRALFRRKVQTEPDTDGNGEEEDEILSQIWGRMRESSFFLFEKDNAFRKWCADQVDEESAFSQMIIFCIIASSLMLVLSVHGSELRETLYNVVDKTFTVIFVFEMLVKMVAVNVVWTQDEVIDEKIGGPYFTQSSNLLDFLIVVVSVMDWISSTSATTGGAGLSAFKALRAFRAVRPLRLISRFEGLALILDCLWKSIPALMNVIIVMLLFIFLFAILGINFFAGMMQQCHMPNALGHLASEVFRQNECMERGGLWLNQSNNFDDIVNAVFILFESMTKESWVLNMNVASDLVEQQVIPISNYNQTMAQIYFLLWIIVGNFFIVNLFVGVIIDNFNMIKREKLGIKMLTSEQKTWVEIQKLFQKSKPHKIIKPPDDPWRNLFQRIQNKYEFEMFITLCILTNTFTMALDQQPVKQQLNSIVEQFNLIFALVFNIEYVIKQQALLDEQFSDSWNVFDFFVVLGTDIGLIIANPFFELIPTVNLNSALSVFRTLRIMRVVRLIKNFKELRMLIDTLIQIIPSLGYIATLLVIAIYIYTALGINILASVTWQGEINRNSNFEDFSTSAMLLLRCSSGEKWNVVMHDYTYTGIDDRQMATLQGDFASAIRICQTAVVSTDEDVHSAPASGCGTQLSYFIFLTFIIGVNFMILKMFVAVVLEGFMESMNDSKRCVNTDHQDAFKEKQAIFDPIPNYQLTLDKAAQLMQEIAPPFGFRDMSIYDENQEKDQLEILDENIQRCRTIFKEFNDNFRYVHEDNSQFCDLIIEMRRIITKNARMKEYIIYKQTLYDNIEIQKYRDLKAKLLAKYSLQEEDDNIFNLNLLTNEEQLDAVIPNQIPPVNQDSEPDIKERKRQYLLAKLEKIIQERQDLEQLEFLEFWHNNRMIKITERDRIKCWRQLGNIRIFRLTVPEHNISRRNSKNIESAVFDDVVNSKHIKNFNQQRVHLKDLLVAMSKRAIIYQNIQFEIERVYKLEMDEQTKKLQKCVNDEERSALVRPFKPNLKQIDAIQYRIKHPHTKYKDSKEQQFQTCNDMEIIDNYKVQHTLENDWTMHFKEKPVPEMISQFNQELLDSRIAISNYQIVNAAKLYGLRTIINFYRNFKKKKSPLSGDTDASQNLGKEEQCVLFQRMVSQCNIAQDDKVRLAAKFFPELFPSTSLKPLEDKGDEESPEETEVMKDRFTQNDLIELIRHKVLQDRKDRQSQKLFIMYMERLKVKREEDQKVLLAAKQKGKKLNKFDKGQKKANLQLQKQVNLNEKIKFDYAEMLEVINLMKISNKRYASQFLQEPRRNQDSSQSENESSEEELDPDNYENKIIRLRGIKKIEKELDLLEEQLTLKKDSKQLKIFDPILTLEQIQTKMHRMRKHQSILKRQGIVTSVVFDEAKVNTENLNEIEKLQLFKGEFDEDEEMIKKVKGDSDINQMKVKFRDEVRKNLRHLKIENMMITHNSLMDELKDGETKYKTKLINNKDTADYTLPVCFWNDKYLQIYMVDLLMNFTVDRTTPKIDNHQKRFFENKVENQNPYEIYEYNLESHLKNKEGVKITIGMFFQNKNIHQKFIEYSKLTDIKQKNEENKQMNSQIAQGARFMNGIQEVNRSKKIEGKWEVNLQFLHDQDIENKVLLSRSQSNINFNNNEQHNGTNHVNGNEQNGHNGHTNHQ